MRILLTGATGFVGSHVARLLVEQGHEVAALVRSPQKAASLPKKGIRLIEGSLENIPVGTLTDVEAVIHLAGLIKASSISEFYRVNTEGTRNLIDSLPMDKIKKFIFVSSISARGPNKTREDPVGMGPQSHYGKSKLAAEEMVRQRCGQIPFSIFRPPVVYGPGDLETFTLFKLFKRGFFPVVGGGDARMSFVYVDDLASALVAAVVRPCGVGPYYPEDGHEGYSWHEVLDVAENIYGKKIRKIPVPLWGARAITLFNEFVLGSSMLNSDKFADLREPYWNCSGAECWKALNLPPAMALKEGFALAKKWYEDQGWV